MSTISIDVDIDEIVWAMGKYDRKELFKEMQKEGYIPKECNISNDGELKLPNLWEQKKLADSKNEFNQALQKLFNNGWRLTNEQEQYIVDLAKQFN